MYVIKAVKKTSLIRYALLIFCIVLLCAAFGIVQNHDRQVIAQQGTETEPDWTSILGSLFSQRDSQVLSGDTDALQSMFLTDERNGQYAYENEVFRSRYLRSWAEKQGVSLQNISSRISIVRSKEVGRGYAFYLIVSTEYTYCYPDDPQTLNMFRMGAYHSIDLIPGDSSSQWIISREWYDDPMTKSFSAEAYTPETTEYIAAQSPADLSGLSEARLAAVQYADTYCGAASDGSNGYKYNNEYTDYNPLGGNCANFASQALYEGGGFKKNGTWNYRAGKGSRAWINAQGFKDYLLYSGRGELIARGKYSDVYKASYQLRPGDIVAYAHKGDTSHISIVTGQDSKGYPLVNSHNLDRYRVPWDIGWNTDSYSFYLIRVNY